jgi:hypothetical protein
MFRQQQRFQFGPFCIYISTFVLCWLLLSGHALAEDGQYPIQGGADKLPKRVGIIGMEGLSTELLSHILLRFGVSR